MTGSRSLALLAAAALAAAGCGGGDEEEERRSKAGKPCSDVPAAEAFSLLPGGFRYVPGENQVRPGLRASLPEGSRDRAVARGIRERDGTPAAFAIAVPDESNEDVADSMVEHYEGGSAELRNEEVEVGPAGNRDPLITFSDEGERFQVLIVQADCHSVALVGNDLRQLISLGAVFIAQL